MPKEKGGKGAVVRSEKDGHLSVSEGRSRHELMVYNDGRTQLVATLFGMSLPCDGPLAFVASATAGQNLVPK
jgi:hypothetical protein